MHSAMRAITMVGEDGVTRRCSQSSVTHCTIHSDDALRKHCLQRISEHPTSAHIRKQLPRVHTLLARASLATCRVVGCLSPEVLLARFAAWEVALPTWRLLAAVEVLYVCGLVATTSLVCVALLELVLVLLVALVANPLREVRLHDQALSGTSGQCECNGLGGGAQGHTQQDACREPPKNGGRRLEAAVVGAPARAVRDPALGGRVCQHPVVLRVLAERSHCREESMDQ